MALPSSAQAPPVAGTGGGSSYPSRRPDLQRVSGTFQVFWHETPRDQEKRQGRRRSLHCLAEMIHVSSVDGTVKTLQADCSNVGDGGLYATVPIGHGVAIGQRYRFRLRVGERGPEPGAAQIVSQYGEIVRVELLLGADGYADRIGIGVRLFGPRSGLVPMPGTA